MRTYSEMQTELSALGRILEKYIQVSKMPHDFGVGEPIYPTEIHLISAIADQKNISVTELAQLHGSTKGAISQVLGKLERKGFITRTPDPDKRSKVRVTVTPKGMEAHQNHCDFHARHDAAFINYLATLGDDAFAVFGELCARMERWMDVYLEETPPKAPTTPKGKKDAE